VTALSRSVSVKAGHPRSGLVWEALRRLATTLELARRAGIDPGPAARARMAAVKAITTLIPR
jgi:hypothetical protein